MAILLTASGPSLAGFRIAIPLQGHATSVGIQPFLILPRTQGAG
jgi:hypothetical protein